MGIFKIHEKWIACGAMFVLYAFGYGPMFCYNLMFPYIQNGMNATVVDIGMVGSLAMASAKLSCPIATIVALLFGYQTTILSGVLITATCLLLSSFATHVIHLYVLFGILYGVGVNLIFYAGTCVILLHFPAQVSYRTLLAGSGTSFGQLLLSTFVQFCLTTIGWQETFQVLSGIVVIFCLPAAYWIKPPEHLSTNGNVEKDSLLRADGQENLQNPQRTISREVDTESRKYDYCELTKQKSSEDGQNIAQKLSNSGKKVKRKNEEGTPLYEHEGRTKKWSDVWVFVLKDPRAWFHFFGCCLIEMAWTGYYINVGSFYETDNISPYRVAILVTMIAIGDLIMKLILGCFGERLPFQKVHLVLLHNAVMIVISLTFPFVKIYSELFLLTFVLGLMRPLGNNIPYLLGEELLGTQLVDEAVTITCVACGLGLVLGALPMGFLFEVTGTYRASFFALAIEFLLSSMLMATLPWLPSPCLT